MKKWFDNLDNGKQKIVTIVTWVLTATVFILIGVLPDNDSISTLNSILAFAFIILLILSIIFSVWYSKNKRSPKLEEQKSNSELDNKSKYIEEIIDCLQDFDFTFVDVETPNKNNDKICALAIMFYKNGKLTFKQNYIINPETRFDDLNMKIHGITPKMVENAPNFPAVWEKISKYFLNATIVGHGVISDINVISKTLQNYGLKLNSLMYIDTLELSKKYVEAKSYKLSELTKEFNKNKQTHDALSDSIDCRDLLVHILKNNNINLNSEIKEYYIENTEYTSKPRQIKNSKETKSYNRIQNLIDKILEDGIVDIAELNELINEIEDNNLVDTYPINNVYKIAKEKLENDDIDIKRELATITGNIKMDIFDKDFSGKLFCLTGDFIHGSKDEISKYIISKGGLVKDNLTQNVDYLVRGLQGSDVYAYGSYGSKVKKALELKEKGLKIKIISENDLY